MKQSHMLLLLGAGSAVLLLRPKPAGAKTALFFGRPDRAAEPPVMPPVTPPVMPVVSWPAEYRRAKTAEVTPLGQARARELVFGDSKLGDFVRFSDNGREYAIIIEPHYHEPGGPVKPWGVHKGATLLIKS